MAVSRGDRQVGGGSRQRWLVLAMVLAALGVRLLFLNRCDPWCDEILFINSSAPQQSPVAILVSHWRNFAVIWHLPFPAMVQNLWLRLVAPLAEDIRHAAGLQRLPAVMWGTGTVLLVFLLGRALWGGRTGLLAAVMCSFFYYPFHYSREAYVYAPLMFLGTAATLLFFRLVRDGNLSRSGAAMFAAAGCGAALSHVTGVLVSVSVAAICIWFLAVNRFAGLTGGTVRKAYLRMWALSLVPLVLVAPFLIQMATGHSPHHFGWRAGTVYVLFNALGKFFLGVRLPAVIAAVGILAVGLRRAWIGATAEKAITEEQRRQQAIGRTYAAFWCVLFGLLLAGVMYTVYVPRYFATAAILSYPLFALGLEGLAEWLSRVPRIGRIGPRRLATGLLGIILVPHVLFFLPWGWQLRAKGVDYGGIARWLNANLVPGTPYIMESGYDLRFVSQYYPTPGLIPVCPYIHGPGPEEMQRLRRAQQAMMLLFPVSAFVESAWHGREPGSDVPVWEWPHRFYARFTDLTNRPLQRLASSGIWPQIGMERMAERQFHTRIWYNRPQDVVEALRRVGETAVFYFDGWRCVQVGPYQYGWGRTAPRGRIRIRGLEPRGITGRVALTAAVAGGSRAYRLNVVLPGGETPAGRSLIRQGNQLWSLEFDGVELGEKERILEIVVEDPGSDFRGLVITAIRFFPTRSVHR